jgi:hypothetical protein
VVGWPGGLLWSSGWVGLFSWSFACEEPSAVEHHTSIHEMGEGGAQAVCSCGWRSPVFGTDKTAGTMDALPRAADAGDLHEWEMSLR